MEYASFTRAYDAIATGYSEGHYQGQRYGVRKQISADGKRGNLVAKELGGNDYISLNFYRLSDGTPKLKPCEMPETKVMAFVIGFKAE